MTLGLVVLTRWGVVLAADSRKMHGDQVVDDDSAKVFNIARNVGGIHAGKAFQPDDMRLIVERASDVACLVPPDTSFSIQASVLFETLVEHWQPTLAPGETISFAVGAAMSRNLSVGAVCRISPVEYQNTFFECLKTENARGMCIGEKELGDRLCGQPGRFAAADSLDTIARRCVAILQEAAGAQDATDQKSTIGGFAQVAVIDLKEGYQPRPDLRVALRQG